jgi:hypothetical protein
MTSFFHSMKTDLWAFASSIPKRSRDCFAAIFPTTTTCGYTRAWASPHPRTMKRTRSEQRCLQDRREDPYRVLQDLLRRPLARATTPASEDREAMVRCLHNRFAVDIEEEKDSRGDPPPRTAGAPAGEGRRTAVPGVAGQDEARAAVVPAEPRARGLQPARQLDPAHVPAQQFEAAVRCEPLGNERDRHTARH